MTCYFDSPASVRALAGVSFAVRRGEVFGLLGSAGSGKSTVMRILAGRLSPSDGKAIVFGRSPRRRASRARIGYLPQKPEHARSRLWARFTGLWAGLFRRAQTKARSSKASAQCMDFDRRTLLKQILVKNPALVLLDDPFAGFDGPACEEIREFIRSFSKQGQSVILTARSLSLAVGLCHRVAVLSRGRVEATGPIEELLATPQSLRYVGELVPASTAERALHIVREDLGVSLPCGLPDATSPKAGQPGADGAAGILALSQPHDSGHFTPGHSGSREEAQSDADSASDGAINHEMLAALTKTDQGGSAHSQTDPPQASKAKPG